MTPNGPQLEASQRPSVGEWINGLCVLYPIYHGIWLPMTPAIQRNINRCHNMDESQKHDAKRRKAEHKSSCTSWSHLYEILEKEQNCSDRKQICGHPRPVLGEGVGSKWA